MKAARKYELEFEPVVLTLETQQEVDGLYSFLRHTISSKCGFDQQYECLEAFKKDYEPYMSALSERNK